MIHPFNFYFKIQALSARNIEVITWLCSKLDSTYVFSKQPPIAQSVLLSLIQQLGFDLSKDSALKLNWLREAILQIDPTDHVVKEHSHLILSQLMVKLEQALMRNTDPSLLSSIKLLMHVVNSLLK
jgi:enhancer of mRNA-decapping protein 4